MKFSEMKIKHRVDIVERDSWSYPKIDEVMYFDSKEAAYEFMTKYNAKNNLPHVPDWYMVAEYKGPVPMES